MDYWTITLHTKVALLIQMDWTIAPHTKVALLIKMDWTIAPHTIIALSIQMGYHSPHESATFDQNGVLLTTRK
eukprot:13526571-Ditylum_brightwellii.AAC.1